MGVGHMGNTSFYTNKSRDSSLTRQCDCHGEAHGPSLYGSFRARFFLLVPLHPPFLPSPSKGPWPSSEACKAMISGPVQQPWQSHSPHCRCRCPSSVACDRERALKHITKPPPPFQVWESLSSPSQAKPAISQFPAIS